MLLQLSLETVDLYPQQTSPALIYTPGLSLFLQDKQQTSPALIYTPCLSLFLQYKQQRTAWLN